MKISKVRDLTLISLDEFRTMVVACDSCGSIGMKSGDTFKVPTFYVGKFSVRVPLLEVISAGAGVVTVTDTVCNEMEPTGLEIIKGIKEELKLANIEDIVLTGSTEENFKSVSTGVGVTVIGIAKNEDLKVNTITKDCTVISLGLPKVGEEVGLTEDLDIASYEEVRNLLKLQGTYEIVPVGSKGILYEAMDLGKNNNMEFQINKEVGIDVKRSAGPATVVIAAVNDAVLDEVKDNPKVNIIGKLIKIKVL